MILAGIFQTVEFYVIVSVIAAAVVAACAMPSTKSAVRTFLYSGDLLDGDGAEAEPEIVLTCNDNGTVSVERRGLPGIGAGGAYSLAVKLSGFDAVIEERLTAGPAGMDSRTAAWAVIDCFAQERYHIQYRSEATGRSAAMTLNIRPGNTISRRLL